MALDIQYVSLDISKRPTPQQVRLGQGDANGTRLVASIFDSGVAYSLANYSVRLSMHLPGSDTYYGVDGTSSGNVATFDIDETYAATSYGADGFGYVDVMNGETVICSTSRFQLVVLRSAEDDADPSTAYSNGIRESTERAIAAAEAAEGVVLQDVPLMSATIRGGAQLGSGLSITDGVLSVDGATIDIPTMAANVKGGAKLGAGLSVANDTLSLDLPTMGASTKGGAKLGSGMSVVNDVLSLDSHTHAASDVTSGEIPIAHGGTGAATAAAALSNLGAAAVDSDGFVTVAGEPSYPLFIWDSTHVSPEDYSGTYPISPCFVYYIPNKGLYYCTDN